MVKWFSKRKNGSNILDPTKFKIGSMVDWSTRAEYYHANWVKESVGPFKATAKLVNALEIEPNDSVLDLACGTGAVSKEITRHLSGSGLLVGIDLSRTALSIANSWVSSLSNTSFLQMDAESMGFERIFNKVACQYALSFFPDPARAMKEVRNVMKDQGIIGIVVHGAEDSVPYLSIISRAVSKHLPDTISRRLLSVHRFGRTEKLSELLTESRFSNVSISKYTFEFIVGSFEEYWSEFFLNGYGNALKPIIFNNKSNAIIPRVKSDAKEMASQYMKNEIIRFPWQILIALAHS